MCLFCLEYNEKVTNLDLKNPIFRKVMNPQQYSKISYSSPYILSLSKTNPPQKFLYYGTEHSNDPRDQKFDDIEDRLKKFIENKSTEKVVITIEQDIPKEKLSRDKMIANYRESGFLTYLADLYLLKKECPEPKGQIIPLLRETFSFDKDDIAVLIFLNMFHHIFKNKQSISRDKLVECFISLDDSFDYNRLSEDMTNNEAMRIINSFHLPLIRRRLATLIGESIFPDSLDKIIEDFDRLNLELIKKLQDPHIAYSVFNDIGAALNNVRDRFIAARILEILLGGNSVFAVFGTNHVIAQEPLFRYYFVTDNFSMN